MLVSSFSMTPVLTMLMTSDPVNTLPHVSIRMYQGSDPIIRRLSNKSHKSRALKLQKSSCPTSFINDDCVRRTNKLLSFVIELDKGLR